MKMVAIMVALTGEAVRCIIVSVKRRLMAVTENTANSYVLDSGEMDADDNGSYSYITAMREAMRGTKTWLLVMSVATVAMVAMAGGVRR